MLLVIADSFLIVSLLLLVSSMYPHRLKVKTFSNLSNDRVLFLGYFSLFLSLILFSLNLNFGLGIVYFLTHFALSGLAITLVLAYAPSKSIYLVFIPWLGYFIMLCIDI